MPKIIIGSHSMKADSKEELLDFINERWDWFYNKNWNSGAYWYEMLQGINDKYFNKNFKITKQEAAANYQRIFEIKSEPYLYAKFKLMWYIHYGEDNKVLKQTTLEDFMEVDNVR